MDSDYQKHLNAVLKLLSIRPRSKKEIVGYLVKKELSEELVTRIINYLEDHKLIDDDAFAKWVIESRSRSRPRGSRLLMQELKSKGIDHTTIADNLSNLSGREPQLAFQALQKKLPLWIKLPYREYRTKAARYLAARGFSWSVIETVVKKGYNGEDVN